MNKLQKSIEKEKVVPFFEAWSELEEDIRAVHASKKSGASTLMNEGIILYKSLLDLCRSDDEKIEPVNNSERLDFVESNCQTFAAYRQLQELFSEMQKKIASKRAVLNKNK